MVYEFDSQCKAAQLIVFRTKLKKCPDYFDYTNHGTVKTNSFNVKPTKF